MGITVRSEEEPEHEGEGESDPSYGVTNERLAGFSDGVFAIAITLLVLELTVPHVEHGLGGAILSRWPSYLSYVTSFITVGTLWINHHSAFQRIPRLNHTLVLVNMTLLFFVSLIPFPTALLAEYIRNVDERSLVTAIYTAVFIGCAGSFWVLWRYVGAHPAYTDLAPAALRRAIRRSTIGLLLYLLAFAFAFVAVTVSIALNVVIVIYYLIPRRLTPSRRRHISAIP